MANQITDNRTLVAAATNATTYVDLGGGAANIDTDVFILGDRSGAFQSTNSKQGVMVDLGAATDVSNNVFYLWVNCGVVGLLDDAALGGFSVRFAGATISDYFEVNIAGNDFWPLATEGGWVMFVVDIERAAARATLFGATGGTPPATNAIRYVGISTIQVAMGAKMVDNTWLNGVWRLPHNSPGILIEGQNGGTTPWTSDDIVTAVGLTSGIFNEGYGGAYVFNTSVQVGIADTTTHAVDFSGDTWLFDNLGTTQANSDLYGGISVLSASGGSVTVDAGISSGSGNNLNGSGGWSVSSAPSPFAAGGSANNNRWIITFDNSSAGTETVNLYGSAFTGLGTVTLEDANTTIAGTVFTDIEVLQIGDTGGVTIGAFTNNTVSNTTVRPSPEGFEKIINCSFIYGAFNRQIEILNTLGTWTTSAYDFIGNLFSGFGADAAANAAIENNTGVNLTINILNGGDVPTKLETSGTITFVESIAVTISGILGNSEIKVLPTSGSPYSGNALSDTLGIATETVSADTNVGDGGSNYVGYTNNGGFVQINANGTNTFTNFPGVLQDTNSTLPRALAAGDKVRVIIRDDTDNTSLQLFDEFVVSGTPSSSAILTTTSFSGFTSAFGTTLNSANSKTVTVEKVGARYQFTVPSNTEIDFLTYRIGSDPILTTGQTITNDNRTFPLTQSGDRNYNNPA